MLDVLAREEGGESDQGAELTRIVPGAGGNDSLAVESVLLGTGHHSAAVVVTVHTRGEPDPLVSASLAVNGDASAAGLVFTEETLDRDRGIIDLLNILRLHFVACLTAVSVDAVADAVEDLVGFAAYLANGDIFYVFVDTDGLGLLADIKITEKIVARSRSHIVDVAELNAVGVVEEAVERAVAAAEDHGSVSLVREEFGIGLDIRHRNDLGGLVLAALTELFRRRLARTVARVGIVKNVICCH